ncbi:MAG: hypothetical protein HQ593_01875 [Candidatus Omnitrophica bacterium]|nr:hypothetical protein [Candidatus Omnitrophota bacterium]
MITVAKKKSGKGFILIGITGSIAAYRACEIIASLRKAGYCLQALMTKEASHFVTPLTLQTLTENEVVQDMFQPPAEWDPLHTSLADKADLILIAPATANIIGKLASGIVDDIITCTVFATKAPVLLAPAMNDNMYKNKITQANIRKLKEAGYKFVGPIKGHLACGRAGEGHIADTAAIVKAARQLIT